MKTKSKPQSIPEIIDSVCTPELAWRKEMVEEQKKNSKLTPAQRVKEFRRSNRLFKGSKMIGFEYVG